MELHSARPVCVPECANVQDGAVQWGRLEQGLDLRGPCSAASVLLIKVIGF